MKTKSLAILSSAFEMKRLLKQKSSRMMLHFSISDCIVDLRCVSAVHDFVVRVLIECSYGLIFFPFQCSSTLCQAIPVVYENECSTLVAKVHC